MPISFAKAALGGEVEVPTLDGNVKYTIPEGTETGTTFRLRGKGIPFVNSKSRGDLIFQVSIETPRGLSEAQKELLRKFAASLGEKNNTKKESFLKKLFNK